MEQKNFSAEVSEMRWWDFTEGRESLSLWAEYIIEVLRQKPRQNS